MTSVAPPSSWSESNADRYDAAPEDWYLQQQHRRLAKVVTLLRRYQARGPVLELGAMAGGFARWYGPALGIAPEAIFCSDFAPRQLEQAKQRGFQPVLWDLEAQKRVPTAAGVQFQTVLLCEVVEHLTNPEDTLNALAEVSAPGALLVLTTPNLASLGNRLRLLRGRTPSCGAAPGLSVRMAGSLAAPDHLRVCVPGEWEALVEHCGFTVQEVCGATSAPERAGSLRQRLSLALNGLLENAPGRLFMNTVIVARRR